MKVYIDNKPLETGHKGRGIGIYTKNLIESLNTLRDESFTVVASKDEAEIIHYPYFDFFFHTLPIYKNTKTIVTVHDTIPLVFPKKFKPGIKGSIKLMLQSISLKNVKAIITDSQNSNKDIQKYLKIKAKKIHTIPLALGKNINRSSQTNISKTKKELNLSRKYFLYVGDINYNKNLPTLIGAFLESGVDSDLVIVSRALENKHIPESKEIFEAAKDSEKIKFFTKSSD
ncbi:glycosyltransferase, partial [Patescibacteria group bacterium]